MLRSCSRYSAGMLGWFEDSTLLNETGVVGFAAGGQAHEIEAGRDFLRHRGTRVGNPFDR
jgi:hypothetical protein